MTVYYLYTTLLVLKKTYIHWIKVIYQHKPWTILYKSCLLAEKNRQEFHCWIIVEIESYKSLLSYILCWFINFTFKTSIIHPLFDSAIPEKLNSKLILRLWTKFRIKIEIFIEWKLLILQQNWPNKMWFINLFPQPQNLLKNPYNSINT